MRKVLGTTDEVKVCGLCGRDDLKKTVILEEDGISYYGVDCAAKLMGIGQGQVRVAARIADNQHHRDLAAARAAEAREASKPWMEWVQAQGGFEATYARYGGFAQARAAFRA